MADVALIVDRDGRILYTNRELAGQPMTGTTVFEHDLGAEAEARMRAALHHVMAAGKPVSYEVEAADEHGATAWYMSRWSPIRRAGEVVAALVVASDVTRAGSRRDEWQDVILESAAEGIFGLDRDGAITFANAP